MHLCSVCYGDYTSENECRLHGVITHRRLSHKSKVCFRLWEYRCGWQSDGEERLEVESMGVSRVEGYVWESARLWGSRRVAGEREEVGVKEGGLQCRNSHVGFLWADLGSWCLDKASDFPARNVQVPGRLPTTERQRERETDQQTDRQTDRIWDKAVEVQLKKKRRKNVCECSLGGESESGNWKRGGKVWLILSFVRIGVTNNFYKPLEHIHSSIQEHVNHFR